MSLPGFAFCVLSAHILLCAVNVWSSSCNFLAVYHIQLPDIICSVQCYVVKFRNQSLFCNFFAAAAFPDAYTAFFTKVCYWHSANLQMYKVTPCNNVVLKSHCWVSVKVHACDSFLHIAMWRIWQHIEMYATDKLIPYV